MTRYLLGDASAEERAALEEKYLNDDEVFQELIGVENELIDRYLLGDLPRDEKEKFERCYLSHPARRETVETARALLAHAESASNISSTTGTSMRPNLWFARKPSWPMLAATAAVFLVMISGISALLVANHRLKVELSGLQTRQTQITNDRASLQQQIDNLKADLQQRNNAIRQLADLQKDPGIVPFFLGGEVARGDNSPKTLIIPNGASSVSLHLLMGADVHSAYTVALRTTQGKLVWLGKNVPGQTVNSAHQEIAVVLPARFFRTDDYVIRVTIGREDVFDTVAGFTFHVVKR